MNLFSLLSENISSVASETILLIASPTSLSNRSNSEGAIGRLAFMYLLKMSFAPSALGRSILILISSLPGRRTAGSSKSCRLLAPTTMTSFKPSTPSISARNVGTTVDSISDDIPIPLERKSESISSKKITTGNPSLAFSRAFWKTSRIFRSVSPTYLLRSSGPLTLMKYPLILSLPVLFWICFARLFAIALATKVFPHPGGP